MSFKLDVDQFATLGRSLDGAALIRRMHPCTNYPDCTEAVCFGDECEQFEEMTVTKIRQELEFILNNIKE